MLFSIKCSKSILFVLIKNQQKCLNNIISYRNTEYPSYYIIFIFKYDKILISRPRQITVCGLWCLCTQLWIYNIISFFRIVKYRNIYRYMSHPFPVLIRFVKWIKIWSSLQNRTLFFYTSRNYKMWITFHEMDMDF